MKNTEVLYQEGFDINLFEHLLPQKLLLYMRFHSRSSFESLIATAVSLFVDGSRKIILLRNTDGEIETSTDSFMELMEMHGAHEYIKVLEFEPNMELYLKSLSGNNESSSLEGNLYHQSQAVELTYTERAESESQLPNKHVPQYRYRLIQEIEDFMNSAEE